VRCGVNHAFFANTGDFNPQDEGLSLTEATQRNRVVTICEAAAQAEGLRVLPLTDVNCLVATVQWYALDSGTRSGECTRTFPLRRGRCHRSVTHAVVITGALHAFSGRALFTGGAGLTHTRVILTSPIHTSAVNAGQIGIVTGIPGVARGDTDVSTAREPQRTSRTRVAAFAQDRRGLANTRRAHEPCLAVRGSATIASRSGLSDARSKRRCRPEVNVTRAMKTVYTSIVVVVTRPACSAWPLASPRRRTERVAPKVDRAFDCVTCIRCLQRSTQLALETPGLAGVGRPITIEILVTRLIPFARNRVITEVRTFVTRLRFRFTQLTCATRQPLSTSTASGA
jgi:hypothetical protein